MGKRLKIVAIVVLVLLLLVVFVVPPIIGAFVGEKIVKGVQDALGVPVKADSVSVSLLPPGATLKGVRIGNDDPAADNKPIAAFGSIKASVTFGTVLSDDMHITDVTLSDADIRISVNDRGVSSLAVLLENMPPSTRTKELPIDALTLKALSARVYMPARLRTPGLAAGEADASVQIGYARINDLIMAAPGQSLGREILSTVDIRDVRFTAPTLGARDTPAGGLKDGAAIGSISAVFSQAPSNDKPLTVKSASIRELEVATVYTRPGVSPAITRASRIVPLGLKPGSKDTGDARVPLILVERFKIESGKLETRGPDADGRPAYWRLPSLDGGGENLAFGRGVSAAGPGSVTLKSVTESSSGPGQMSFTASDVTGTYPHWNANVAYSVSGIAAPAFSVAAEESSKTKIKSGTIAMEFAGPIENGNLKIDGSITLSPDLEVTGTVASAVARITRGKPIKTVRIRGTLEQPDVQFPDAFSGLVEKMFKSILSGGPMGALDAVGGFMGTSVEQGMREAGKVINTIDKQIDKLPVPDAVKNPIDSIKKIFK